MGYTNYWYVKTFKKFPQKFIDQMKSLEEIAKKREIDCVFEFEKDYIIVNGVHCFCENMVVRTNMIRKSWQEVREDGGVFDCCKTLALPYDAIVKAAIMAAIENDLVTAWDFDGDASEEEYENALEIAKLAGIKECPPNMNNDEEL